ncbi:DNA-binding protein EMBP-1-like isoform X2 [Phragmites australis]|uniref:DNA-binding protein EMBP-1-like isoform X2 n=1 Tax=Phragmites australis TaxID=29695 RepID=UPI002D7A0BD9|nr:DNA-binding protein EMBP-1-like isoform X2 [Phragmites australis]
MASSSDEQPKPPEPPAAPLSHAEWAASLQAYYAAAGHPYAWPAQHLMAAAAAGATYAAPVPFPVYHPGAAVAYYAHASMAAGAPYPTREAVAAAALVAEGKGKGKGAGASPEKGSSGEDASQSGDSGSEESSETRDDDTDHKDLSAPKKRKSGEPSRAAVVRYAAVESPYPVKGRSASKLPVSAPGRAALPSAAPNLNIGMDLWSASPALAVPAVQGEANTGLALARRDDVTHLDERELKRERRKQSNRESARRSRLRKQQECEELGRKVADLTTENNALRAELDNIKKACKEMEAENSRLVGGVVHSQVPSVTTTLGMSIEAPKAQQHDDEGQLHKNTNNNSNGNYIGGSHKQEANTTR